MSDLHYYMKDATLPELFEAAKMVDHSVANGKYRDEGIALMGTVGYAFTSARQNAMVPFGYSKAKYGVKVSKDKKFFCYSVRSCVNASTYMKPTKLLKEMLGGVGYSDERLSEDFSFEFVRQAGSDEVVLFARTKYISSYRIARFSSTQVVKDFIAELLKDDPRYAGFLEVEAIRADIKRFVNEETKEVYIDQLKKSGYFLDIDKY